jgi:hypothetical protein
MTSQSIVLLVVFLATLLALAYPLGMYLAKVGDGTPIRGMVWVIKIENFLYRIAGITAASGMNWKTYAIALLTFNALGAVFVYAVQRLQAWLPLNPQAFANISPDCDVRRNLYRHSAWLVMGDRRRQTELERLRGRDIGLVGRRRDCARSTRRIAAPPHRQFRCWPD